MDTTELEAAYRELLDAARAGGFGPPAEEGGWSAELVLAAVVATDRLLAAATAEVLAGASARYDNAPATRAPYLRAIARAAGDLDGLVAEARRCGLELVLLARELGEAAATPVDVRLLDGDEVRLAAPMPWSGMLATHAEVHLRERREALAALSGGAAAGR